MGSPECEEATFFFASSRYVLYLESTIAFLNIDSPSTKHSPHLRIRETLTLPRTRNIIVKDWAYIVVWVFGRWPNIVPFWPAGVVVKPKPPRSVTIIPRCTPVDPRDGSEGPGACAALRGPTKGHYGIASFGLPALGHAELILIIWNSRSQRWRIT
jgi:hypothetical protein